MKEARPDQAGPLTDIYCEIGGAGGPAGGTGGGADACSDGLVAGVGAAVGSAEFPDGGETDAVDVGVGEAG
jgi:hypothetical protein